MQSSKNGGESERSPLKDSEMAGTRFVSAIFIVVLAGLLSAISWQTTSSQVAGGSLVVGGWWTEPSLMPAVSLVIGLTGAVLAFFTSTKEKIDIRKVLKSHPKVMMSTLTMVGFPIVITILGFTISVFIFTLVAGKIAGFKGWSFAALSVGLTVSMVLIFRIGFSVWFPRPALYSWIHIPSFLEVIL